MGFYRPSNSMSETESLDLHIVSQIISRSRLAMREMTQEIGEESFTVWICKTLNISQHECTPNAPENSVKETDAMIPFRNEVSLEESLQSPLEYWTDEVYNRFFIVK